MLLLLLLLMMAGPLRAQEGVTVEELVEAALARNPQLLAARARIAEAAGVVRQAGLRPNPGLDIGYASGAALNSPGESELSLEYSHTIELGGKRGRRLDAARAAAAVAEREVADDERLLAAGVRARYGEALAASRNLAIAEEMLDLAKQNLRVVEARVREGEAPRVEQGLIQVEVSRLESDRVLFASRVEGSLLELKTLAGMDADAPLRLRGPLAAAAAPPLLAEAIQRALAARPDLAAARFQEELAAAELASARAEAVPDVVASARYAHSRTAFEQYGLASPGGPAVRLRDRDNTLTAGVTIALPVRNRNQGGIEAAIARERAARLRREHMERVVRLEVRSALARYDAARRALEVFDRGVVPPSRENLQILRAAYQVGELRMLDVIVEQRRLLEAQRAHTDLLRDAYNAIVELNRAIGTRVR